MRISLKFEKTDCIGPYADASFIGISDDCLIIQVYGIKLGLNFAFGGVLAFLFIGLPAILATIAFPFFPPYGYRDGVKIETLSQLLSSFNFSEFNYPVYFFLVLVFCSLFYLLTYNFARVVRNSLVSNISPVIFDRKKRVVSGISNGKEVTTDWGDIEHKSYVNLGLGPALIPMQRHLLELKGLAKIEGDEMLWAYICSFMEQGPDDLRVPVFLCDSWEHLPKYSRSFKEAIDHHWFWPIVRNPVSSKYITYFIWPFKALLFIPFLMVEWFWRRMILKGYSKSKIFPEQRFIDCGCLSEKITGQMATNVYRDVRDNEGINFLEVKRRLKEMN